METKLNPLRQRAEEIKRKRPGYGPILDFYLKVREEQEKTVSSQKVHPILLKKDWKDLLAREGFPLLEKRDFPIDLEASTSLFQTLCRIGKEANPYLTQQIQRIEEAFQAHPSRLQELLREGVNEKTIEKASEESGSDQRVFSFLIYNSIRPSIEAAVEQLQKDLKPTDGLKGDCPICGSLPWLSLLKEETGRKFLLCSFCGHSWRTDRIACPFCKNQDQASLHYFQGEGEETCRIDLCDRCLQYLKMIDLRVNSDLDPLLEDMATLHLDLIASQKGYKRPVPSPWIL